MIERVLRKNEQNVAVAPKEPLNLSDLEQLELMIRYTQTHASYREDQKFEREMACLRVLFPRVFRPMYEDDLIVGRYDSLPIGFGSVTSVGAPGHYCRFDQVEKMKKRFKGEKDDVLNELMEYWKIHDTREVFYRDNLVENVSGRFVDVLYPMIVTARFSGMYLDYNLLLDHGIDGLKEVISLKKRDLPASSTLYDAMIDALKLLSETIHHHIQEVEVKLINQQLSPKRRRQMERLLTALKQIEHGKPNSMISAMQLAWLYSSLTGVVNFGRMDDYLGDYLVSDLKSGRLSEQDAIDMIESQWRLIEVKRTNVNGRVIVGGKGRRNEENADVFCKLAIEATKRAQLVEPQFTLRFYDGMDPEIMDKALESIATGVTYPILYNDDVNVPSVMNTMHVDEKTAENYVPFGCGEFVLSGMGVGTPNVCVNLLKSLTILLNDGVDTWDFKPRNGSHSTKPMKDIESFDELFDEYKKLLAYYIQIGSVAHANSYRTMNQAVGFIYTSILTHDCIGRGKSVLDGGVRHLGGTNEMYGNMNAADSLMAIKQLVFDEKKLTMAQLQDVLRNDFEGYEEIKEWMLEAPKFGNDLEEVDKIAAELHEFTCNEVAAQASKVGLDSWLVVVINNQVNTEWGRATGSSPDGRIAGMYMSNANNPQSGADVNGPTAMLNSLAKIRADLSAGTVQNIKFSRRMFTMEREKVKALFTTYFRKGGPQLMVNIVNQEELTDAYHHPERHRDLIVRVGGFSARYVNLDRDVQKEILERTCNE
ncbi:MAG: pyruvate formate lyase family protein [Erysipelotrichaceae bacterium]